jgi:hypothetical protein
MTRVILFAVAGEKTDALRPLLAELEAQLSDPTAAVGQIDEARCTAFMGVKAQSCGVCAVPLETWESIVELAGEWSGELGEHLIPPVSYRALANLAPASSPVSKLFSQAAESKRLVMQFTASDDDPWAKIPVGVTDG